MSPTKEAVSTPNSPAPLPQFSQAIKYNGMVYCSGSIGKDPVTKELAKGGVQPETRVAIKNISAVLEAAGSSLDNIVKINIFLTTMDDFAAMNEAYDESFGSINPKPCRTCVAVHQLPFGAKMEIECTAFVNPESKM
ncbi:L-psp endoribonuclease family protein [Xylaria longipes]|nr:L-psp endoribonuclease family protein [Xylaria longipes]